MDDAIAPSWDPDGYAKHARYVSDLGQPVVALLSPQPGERILDLGCGDGALTIKLQESGCEVFGVDSSPEMVERARSLGLKAELLDAEALRYKEEFDAVFSNAVLHWVKDPELVVSNVWRALRPGGRFVGEFGGYGNVSAIISGIETVFLSRGLTATNPWFFPRPQEYEALLVARGFVVETMESFPRPTRLPGDLQGWLETFARPYIDSLPELERKDVIAEVTDKLRGELVDENCNWIADYVRLRFRALKSRP